MQPFIFHKRFGYIFVITALFLQSAKAQYEEKDFVRYAVKNGLSDNYITCLQQDARGYLWIGTDVGLNRFDGNSFKKFYQGTTGLPLLSSAVIKLKISGQNSLAIISRGGMQLLNTRDFSLQNYYIKDSTAFSTQLNSAWDAIKLPDQSFAVTTTSGFYVFNNSGKINFRHDAYGLNDIGKKKIFYGREIFSINDKEYIVYVEEAGLAYYNAEKKIFRNIDPKEKEWKAFYHPNVSDVDRWLVKHQVNSHQFIFIYPKKDSIVFYDYTLKRSVVSPLPFHSSIELNWLSKIEMLNDTVFAINGGSFGFFLFHLNPQTGQITCDGKKLMAAYRITCLFVDKDKRLWLGTNEGLLQQKLNTHLLNSYQFTHSPGETTIDGFTCTFRYKNKLYAGRYSQNKGLVIIDPFSMHLKKQIEFYGGKNSWNEIVSMEMYHRDTLWIGTNAGLLWLDTKTDNYGKVLNVNEYPWAADFSPVLAPARTDGYAWMCSFLGGLVVRYHIPSRTFTVFTSQTQPALPFDKVKNIVYDSYGDVWIGGHSLARWNNQQQLFDTLITVYGGANKFNDDILILSADANGSLWLHNASNGLLEYRIKEKKFVAYAMKDGLPSDVLTSFSPVIDNILWIGSNNYLTRFDTRTKNMIIYDESDGLPENKPTGRRIYYDKDSNCLYMSSNEYLVKFPVQPNNNPDNSSELMVEELVINNVKTVFQPGNEIRLNHIENNLTLNYTIVDFEKANYQFAYKLNEDEAWTVLGGQRTIMFNNLQPGKYVVHLKATGKSGNEKLKEFIFIIQPPFWKTAWFLVICGILLVATFYYLYRYRIKRVRQKANIDKLLAQTEMKALHAQMNPHFIFNSLNSIREMILNNENNEASHFLSKFAHLIRMTLDQSGEPFISLRNTIAYLHRYIEMEQIRNSDFTCRIMAQDELDLDETVLPPMLIQPFIENAIWHGTTDKHKNINVNIDFKKDNNQLVCIIDDNGIGIERSVQNRKDHLHKPMGIDNIKNRIQLLNEKYELKSSVIIEDKSNLPGCTETGTKVTLQLPLETT